MLYRKLVTFAITLKPMTKACFLALLCCLSAVPLVAQVPTDSPVDVLRHPGWGKSIFVGAGTSIDSSPGGSNFLIEVRISRVLTEEHGPGLLRGTFEAGLDVVPIDEYWIQGAQYSGGIDPVVLKWNFTNCCKMAPYFALVGGVLFSPRNLPPGDTSQVNFVSGPEMGVQLFRGDRRSLDIGLKVYHLSNASIGNHNPGLNANLQFMVGYTFR